MSIWLRFIWATTERTLRTIPTACPSIEGRMVEAFDHRAKAYVSGRGQDLRFGKNSRLDSTKKAIRPQWRIVKKNIPEKATARWKEYRVAFCDVGGVTNARFPDGRANTTEGDLRSFGADDPLSSTRRPPLDAMARNCQLILVSISWHGRRPRCT